jgi:two-component system, OmpR family, sensor histidine kinase PhoQ
MSLSLTQRLFLSAFVVLCVFLGLVGVVLDQGFTISLDNIVREKLKLHTYALLSVADNEYGIIQLPKKLDEQRFNQEGQSLIAIVTDIHSNEFWRSLSAAGRHFSLPVPREGQWWFGRAKDGLGESYYVYSYSTIWSNADGKKTSYVFTVMERIDEYHKDLAANRLVIIVALIILGIILLVLQAIILRWGLKPVRGLAMDVNAMNKNELLSLTGSYPKELQPLTLNLNALVDNERRQRERYRQRMADLSHSLKTPLSVLRGIESDIDSHGEPLSREDMLETLNRQVLRMSDIVDYQLQRAVATFQQTSFVAINIVGEVQAIVGALEKVYSDKQVLCEIDIDKDLAFYGDENDLIEILGNVLDNAYKHCQQKVIVSGEAVFTDVSQTALQLSIEDDGLGVPAQNRADILKRGVRLDTASEGQGIGLAIVVDIIDSYNGTVFIEDSELGGAQVKLTIPTR